MPEADRQNGRADTSGPEDSDKLALERLVFFSDAVIAIAITLTLLPMIEFAQERDENREVWSAVGTAIDQVRAGSFASAFATLNAPLAPPATRAGGTAPSPTADSAGVSGDQQVTGDAQHAADAASAERSSTPHSAFERLETLLLGLSGYVAGFAVMSVYWFSHHRLFGYLWTVDDRLVRLNLMWLMCIGAVPIAIYVWATVEPRGLPIFLLASILSINGVTLASIWTYAATHRRPGGANNADVLLKVPKLKADLEEAQRDRPDAPFPTEVLADPVSYYRLRLLFPSWLFVIAALIVLHENVALTVAVVLGFVALLILCARPKKELRLYAAWVGVVVVLIATAIGSNPDQVARPWIVGLLLAGLLFLCVVAWLGHAAALYTSVFPLALWIAAGLMVLIVGSRWGHVWAADVFFVVIWLFNLFASSLIIRWPRIGACGIWLVRAPGALWRRMFGDGVQHAAVPIEMPQPAVPEGTAPAAPAPAAPVSSPPAVPPAARSPGMDEPEA